MSSPYPEIQSSISHEEPPLAVPYEVRAYWLDGTPGDSLDTFTAQGETAAIDYAVELQTTGLDGRVAKAVRIKEVHGWPWYWVGKDRTIHRDDQPRTLPPHASYI